MLLNRFYYVLRPYLPRRIQIVMRRQFVGFKRRFYQDVWPIDPNAAAPPGNWRGWPDNKKFALVLSHDVDTQRGHDRCSQLVTLEKEMGFKSSFNFVPERYRVSADLRGWIKRQGFQVCVHGLNHDGKLFISKKIFDQRAQKINGYLREWQTQGFTSPSMHHRLEWLHALDIRHSTSTFDTDPFEPQPDGAGTIYPYWVIDDRNRSRYLELPYTLPQDFTLFILMLEDSIAIWQQKLEWIAEHGGMALINTHSDYMNFEGTPPALEEYPVRLYRNFLEHVRTCYAGQYFNALPSEVELYWSTNNIGSAPNVKL